ncbi:hypothetical protein [Tropicimonas marinistellae]|nr:hypothetical protein [Tropicimonas marinistellae]
MQSRSVPPRFDPVFATVRTSVFNRFNPERSLSSRTDLSKNRAAALAE